MGDHLFPAVVVKMRPVGPPGREPAGPGPTWHEMCCAACLTFFSWHDWVFQPTVRVMASLLVVDDDRSAQHMFRTAFAGTDTNVLTATSANEGVDLVTRYQPDVVVLDIMLPDDSGLRLFAQIQKLDDKIPVIFITGGGTSDTAIEAMKLGAFDYLAQAARLCRDSRPGRPGPGNPPPDARAGAVAPGRRPARAASDLLVGRCPAMQEVYKAIGRVAAQNVNVLIRGESGTGKELVARAIYQHSPPGGGAVPGGQLRRPFPRRCWKASCSATRKGSFTGADAQRIGKFEQCNGGTLFLDEVGDMTPADAEQGAAGAARAALRAGGRQRRPSRPTCGSSPPPTATWRKWWPRASSAQTCTTGSTASRIKLPPLRERDDDIVLLLEHFLAAYSRELGKVVSDVLPRPWNC